MNDQATTLRNMAFDLSTLNRTTTTFPPLPTSHSLAVTGGKGGVGKSNLSVNLALELGLLGYKVALLDADFGLANADLLCGVTPAYHLGHVVDGTRELDDITIALTENVELIPGGSGIEELANFTLSSRPGFFAQMRAMEETLDFMLVDTAAGIAENVSGVLDSASEVLVVVTPEPTSIVDAYATIKILLRRSPDKPVSVVINNVVGVGDAEDVFQSIRGVVRSFLGRSIDFLGMIPHDMQVQEAIREQVPVVHYSPNSPASRAIRLIAKQLHARRISGSKPLKVRSFWDALAAN